MMLDTCLLLTDTIHDSRFIIHHLLKLIATCYITYAQRTRKHEHLTAISSLPLSLPLPLRCPCCCCYLRRCAADATAVSCANDAIIEGDNDDEGSAYNHRRRWSSKMSAKAASHLQIHLNSNFSRIVSAPTPPRCCCTSK